MKVKYIGEKSSRLSLMKDRIYECIGIEENWCRVIDETGEDYLYPPEEFALVDEVRVSDFLNMANKN